MFLKLRVILEIKAIVTPLPLSVHASRITLLSSGCRNTPQTRPTPCPTVGQGRVEGWQTGYTLLIRRSAIIYHYIKTSFYLWIEVSSNKCLLLYLFSSIRGDFFLKVASIQDLFVFILYRKSWEILPFSARKEIRHAFHLSGEEKNIIFNKLLLSLPFWAATFSRAKNSG